MNYKIVDDILNSKVFTEKICGNEWTYYLRKGNMEACIYKVLASGDVSIPSVLGGALVTSIADFAFHNCENVTSISIPESVKNVGNLAFVDCSEDIYDTTTNPAIKLVDGWAMQLVNLDTANLDISGVKGIANNFFFKSINLRQISVDKDNKFFVVIDGSLYSRDKKELICNPSCK